MATTGQTAGDVMALGAAQSVRRCALQESQQQRMVAGVEGEGEEAAAAACAACC